MEQAGWQFFQGVMAQVQFFQVGKIVKHAFRQRVQVVRIQFQLPEFGQMVESAIR